MQQFNQVKSELKGSALNRLRKIIKGIANMKKLKISKRG